MAKKNEEDSEVSPEETRENVDPELEVIDDLEEEAEVEVDTDKDKSPVEKLLSTFRDFVSFRGNKDDMSDNDRRQALQSAIDVANGDTAYYNDIVAVYDSNFVYLTAGPDKRGLFQVDYKISKDGKVTAVISSRAPAVLIVTTVFSVRFNRR